MRSGKNTISNETVRMVEMPNATFKVPLVFFLSFFASGRLFFFFFWSNELLRSPPAKVWKCQPKASIQGHQIPLPPVPHPPQLPGTIVMGMPNVYQNCVSTSSPFSLRLMMKRPGLSREMPQWYWNALRAGTGLVCPRSHFIWRSSHESVKGKKSTFSSLENFLSLPQSACEIVLSLWPTNWPPQLGPIDKNEFGKKRGGISMDFYWRFFYAGIKRSN